MLKNASAQAETLPATSEATAAYSHGVFSFGIPTGKDGEAGNGIDHIVLNDDYTLTIYYTNGNTWTSDSIRGTQGIPGIDGKDGTPGADGKDGKDGKDGIPGIDGKDGKDGKDGEKGDSGEDGFSPTVDVEDIPGGHRVTITDAEGDHTFDVMDGQGGGSSAVQSVNGKTGVVTLDASDVGALPSTDTLDDIPDGTTYKRPTGAQLQQIGTNTADVQQLQSDVDAIEGVIPNQASAANQLADKAFVNSSIQTSSAHFRGNWPTWADVPTNAVLYPVDDDGNTTPTSNDYMVVQDAAGYPAGDEELEGTWRFKFSGVWAVVGRAGWHPEYQVNETPLTAAQLAALNSGATAALIAQITANETAIQAKYTKPASGIPASDMAQDVQTSLGKADTALQSVPITYRTAADQDVIDAGKLDAPATGSVGQILEKGSSGPVWADKNPVVTVTGTTPTINAAAGKRYVCGEVSTLDITLPASGIVDVTFESGSTATVLTITPPTGVTLKWANWFDPTALEANTIYEINIMDAIGVAVGVSA